MRYTTATITTESDCHGLGCPWCEGARPCVTNIYLVDADNEDGMSHSCAAPACIALATGPGRHHSAIREALVEISTAPQPRNTTTTEVYA